MLRGILSGGFWGILTVVIGLSMASLLAPQPAGNRPPDAPQVEAPSDEMTVDAVDPTLTTPDVAAVQPVAGSDSEGQGPAAPLTAAADMADAAATSLADTTPADLPETGGIAAEPVAPEADLPDVVAAVPGSDSDRPVQLAAQTPAPQVPAPEQDLRLSTDPATPAPLPPEPIAETPETPDQPVVVTEDAPAPEADALVSAAVSEPAADAAPDAGSDAMTADPADAVVAAPESVALEEPESPGPDDIAIAADLVADPLPPDAASVTAEPASPEVLTDEPPLVTATVAPAETAAESPQAPVLPDQTAEPVVTPDPETGPLPDTNSPEATSDDAPDIAPVSRLPTVTAREPDAGAMPEPDATVTINRPGSETEADDAVEAATEDPVADVLAPDGPALVRFATAIDNPEGKPLMGVVLIDTGELSGAASVIATLPFPVTIAIDPGAPGAAESGAAYRAAGIEVMALARLPQGARPTDVEVAFEAVFVALPEAVGVLDAGEGGLQANSAVTEQTMARLARDGLGVVTLSKGLNMANRAAEAAGVPAGTIYRDLDSEGQSAQVIRRFMDQAAFRARQTSGVILLGRVRPDTISALMLWGAENRAEQVAVVPISAVLLQE